MCFSASASFTASALLTACSIVLFSRVKNKKLYLIALVPLFFAIQQFAEGILWLHIPGKGTQCSAELAKNVFLFFAFIFWPIWLPFGLWNYEKNSQRKMCLSILLGMGIVVGSLLGLLIPYMEIEPYCFSIHYTPKINGPISNSLFYTMSTGVLIFYFFAVILSMIASSIKHLWVIGILTFISALVTLWIDATFFISMWCFLAAAISLGLIFIIKKKES